MKIHDTSEMNLTKGNLFRKILTYTLPIMLSSVFQLLYTTVDLWTVSQFGGGSTSMSAVGSNGALINLLVTFLISISLGSGVAIGVAKGAQNKESAKNILHTSYIIAIVGGIAFGIMGFFLSPVLLRLMDTPDLIIDKATQYLQIYFIGFPFLALVNFSSQMLRSLGDSKRPMWFLTLSGAINVLFDLFFVIVLGWDVIGVGIATVISWIIAAGLLTWWFMKSETCFVNFKFSDLKVDFESLKDILKVGVPAGLQGIAFCLPNLLIQSSLYTITNYSINGVSISTEEIVVGAAASAQIEGYLFVLHDSFNISNVAFTGQNYGAKKKENMIKCYWYCLIWMSIFWAASTCLTLLLKDQLFGIFIADNDVEGIIKNNAIAAGYERLFLMALTYILDGLMNLNGAYLKGMKKSLPPAIITIICCTGVRIVFLSTLFKTEFFHTVFWLYAAFPITWILASLAYLPTVLIIQKKRFKEIESQSI